MNVLINFEGKVVNVHSNETPEKTLQRLYCALKDHKESEFDGKSKTYCQLMVTKELQKRTLQQRSRREMKALRTSIIVNNFVDALLLRKK